MSSVDDVMNMITWVFLEMLFGVQHLSWSTNLLTSSEAEVRTQQIKWKDSVYFTDQKTLLEKLRDQVDENMNQLHL